MSSLSQSLIFENLAHFITYLLYYRVGHEIFDFRFFLVTAYYTGPNCTIFKMNHCFCTYADLVNCTAVHDRLSGEDPYSLRIRRPTRGVETVPGRQDVRGVDDAAAAQHTACPDRDLRDVQKYSILLLMIEVCGFTF